MDHETLARRLKSLGIPYVADDLEKLLPQWQMYVDTVGRFPDLDPTADEPAVIFHPEVIDDDRRSGSV